MHAAAIGLRPKHTKTYAPHHDVCGAMCSRDYAMNVCCVVYICRCCPARLVLIDACIKRVRSTCGGTPAAEFNWVRPLPVTQHNNNNDEKPGQPTTTGNTIRIQNSYRETITFGILCSINIKHNTYETGEEKTKEQKKKTQQNEIAIFCVLNAPAFCAPMDAKSGGPPAARDAIQYAKY